MVRLWVGWRARCVRNGWVDGRSIGAWMRKDEEVREGEG